MIRARLVFIVAVSVLVVQILMLETVLPVPTFSYGASVERAKERMIELRAIVYDSAYSAYQETPIDSVVLVGDVMLGRNVEVLMEREGYEYPYQGLPLTSLAQNPAIVGNFESSMAPSHVTTPAQQMKFSVPKQALSALHTAGFSHFSLANNHSLDYGSEGYQNALSLLSDTGINTFGHGTVLSEDSLSYFKTAQGSIAIVGINASANIPTQKDIKAVLKEASEQSDLQIVYIHWGIEYDLVHNKTQSLLARELVEAGADLIVGHHPHVVQDIDVIDGVVVFYSLGNYIFDQYFSKDVKEGLVLALELHGEPVISLVPVESKRALSQPTLMAPDDHARFLKKLAERSHPSLRDSIERGLIPLGDAVATSTKMAMMMP